ncbi:RNA ligase [Actinocorallia longicatena]|uniref:Uncharacterized protein n=1 Tax=Actinocorallia longicatena TaxID=111803 RepID=A0ABP6PYA0_9ACTN
MRLHLSELMDRRELAEAIEAGYVRVQAHPHLPLRILNYTEKTQYERAWTAVTRACRGLVIDADDYVVARPFPKFFNYSEHEASQFDLDARVVVTDKMDGCFVGSTTLNLWGGGTITIGEVVRNKLPVTLVGMDEAGELVPATVTDWHYNGTKDHWLDVTVGCPVSRRSGAGGHANVLRVTVNHHLYVNGAYVPACDVRPGDRMVRQAWQPSAEVYNLVRASLLGDGCVMRSATKPDQAKYQEGHSARQGDYVEALRKAMGDCVSVRADTVSGYGSRIMWVGTKEYTDFGDLRREWYPDGVKRVPADLSWLDDFAVAKWLMDDGYRQRFKAQADRISFATHSFTLEEIARLGDRLAELYGISWHTVDDGGRGHTLVINSGRRQQIERLWAAIAPHVHPTMRYKLPERHQDVPYREMPVGRELSRAEETEVLSVERVEVTKQNFPHGRVGYDVSTTTENYLARGVLVHNSLGILYPTPDGHAIATRGSFGSEQSAHASKVWRDRYAAGSEVNDGVTWLFEIIFPQNRIVCDYGDLDDLVLLGGVEKLTGKVIAPADLSYRGPRSETFAYRTLAEVLAAEPRRGAEGLVIRFPDKADLMIKVKQEDYVALHRVITGLNARGVWERLGAGDSVQGICEGLPDEFHGWVQGLAKELFAQRDQLVARVAEEHARIVSGLPDGWGRKEYAAVAGRSANRGWLFLALDGKDASAKMWHSLKPAGDLRPVNVSEDTA